MNPANRAFYDWRPDIFATFGRDAVAIALGYAFLAYRGLSTQDYGRRVYGQRRRRFTPPSDAE